MSGKHALLGPSKAAMWGGCHGAIAATIAAELPPEVPNIHAASGTCSHSLAERMLNGKDIPAIGTKETHDGFEFELEEDRIERVGQYVDLVRSYGGLQFYEVSLDLAPILEVAEQFGTSDSVVVDLEKHSIGVIDFKDGMGFVSALGNAQLILYLAAALHEFSYLDTFTDLWVQIAQPRIGNMEQPVHYTVDELQAHVERLKRAAHRSMDLIGQSPAKIRAAMTPGAEQCKWCPIRGNCEVRMGQMTEHIHQLPQKIIVNTLSDAQIAEIMNRETEISDFFDAVRGEALGRAKLGHQIPGWKLVTGRQGPRKWKGDEGEIGEKIYEAITADAYTRELISPTVAERKLKKNHSKLWAELQDSIERSDGTPTLAPDIDKRRPLALDVPEFQNVLETGADLL